MDERFPLKSPGYIGSESHIGRIERDEKRDQQRQRKMGEFATSSAPGSKILEDLSKTRNALDEVAELQDLSPEESESLKLSSERLSELEGIMEDPLRLELRVQEGIAQIRGEIVKVLQGVVNRREQSSMETQPNRASAIDEPPEESFDTQPQIQDEIDDPVDNGAVVNE